MVLPRQLVEAFVELVGVCGGGVAQHEDDARGDAAPQAGAVGGLKVAGEGHLAVERSDSLRAEACELAGQQLLEPLGAGCEELERRARCLRVSHVNHLSGHHLPVMARGPGGGACCTGWSARGNTLRSSLA